MTIKPQFLITRQYLVMEAYRQGYYEDFIYCAQLGREARALAFREDYPEPWGVGYDDLIYSALKNERN